MKRRDANLILIALAAFGGGGVAAVLPLSLVEMVLTTSGLSETVPTFTPPLGDTARSLLIGIATIVCGGLIALFLPWGKDGRQFPGEKKERGMSFIFSRLAFFIRGRKEQAPEGLEKQTDSHSPAEVPLLRRSDTHPDAPARPPLLARRDLGEEALPQSDIPAAELEKVSKDASLSSSSPAGERVEAKSAEHLPPAPEPLSWTLIEQEMSRLLSGAKLRIDSGGSHAGEDGGPLAATVEAFGKSDDATDPSLPQPTIEELLERLERGLQRKRRKLLKSSPKAELSVELLGGKVPASCGEEAGNEGSDEDSRAVPEAAVPTDPEAK